MRFVTLAGFVVAAIGGSTLLTAGCSGPAPKAPAAAAPAFELAGWRIIGCCCAAPCPCRLNKKPMHCHGCDHTDVVRIDRGHIGPTRMDGVSWVMVGRGFGEKPDGNWVVLYLDERATPEQEKALAEMLTADVKAFGAKAKHLAGSFKGIRRAPVRATVSADGKEYAASIPGVLEFKTRALYNPGQTQPVVSTGIMDAFGDRFVHADCLVHTYRDDALGYKWDLTGRQANQAEFRLTPDRVAKGGIGWGCWTAHAEFSDQGKYQEQMLQHEK